MKSNVSLCVLIELRNSNGKVFLCHHENESTTIQTPISCNSSNQSKDSASIQEVSNQNSSGSITKGNNNNNDSLPGSGLITNLNTTMMNSNSNPNVNLKVNGNEPELGGNNGLSDENQLNEMQGGK